MGVIAMRFEFRPEYEIGIAEIDAEHRQFFDYVNAAIDAMDMSHEEGLAVAKNLLVKLTKYAQTHLEHEEALMRRTNDAELPIQLKAHDAFRSRVAELTAKDDLTIKDLGEIFIFMAKWLRDHIVTMDKMIGRVKSTGKFVMTNDFYTGIDFIDEQHATLFDIIGRVQDAIDDEMLHDRFDVIMDVIGELRRYTQMHFADEERHMESIGYEGLAAQKIVHTAFIDRVSEIDIQDISDSSEDEQNEYLRSLIAFLTDWLVQHILKMDKLIPTK